MIYTILTIVHVLVCVFLIVVVLLQSGKAADLAGAFGGMGSQTAFGPRGSATLLSKATTGSAILFMVTSLSLSIMATRQTGVGSTVLDKHPGSAAPKQTAPSPGTSVTPPPPQTATPPGATPMQPVTSGSGEVKPGQPSVTLSNEDTGEKRTIPLNIPPAPKNQPAPPKK
ncbi:MAG TPA: preprotein translocase subunit SecG [Bryobacteraceae bacterium]|nr:preprotein translocase subunit SecG [Bryobacteraceae bacterium]